MDSSIKPILLMLGFGFARHALGVIGAWLLARSWIDADTHAQLTTQETATRVVSWLMVSAPFAWSALQKWQVWGWLRTKIIKAIHAEASLASVKVDPSPQAIITAAPGPDMPI